MAATAQTVTFLMVGCQRCGTTWVDAALREHPQVHLPPQKQTYFFDRHFGAGDDHDLAWYLGQFDGAGPEHRAVGEVATGYSLPHAIPPMAEHFPHVKLIMSMRHPVERAYSNYLTRCAEEGWPSFEAALETSPDLLERGRYIEQIEGLLQHYPRERILFLLYEDLARDDRVYLRSILEFLDVDASFESSQIGRRMNAARMARLRRTLHRMGLKPALRALSRSPIGDLVRRRTRTGGRDSSTTMDARTRARLVEAFEPFNARLARFLERDLDGWNR